MIDISSSSDYPGSALSNFAPHRFVFDDVECASMEGLLQSFKHEDAARQIEVCGLSGLAAKRAGGRDWESTQMLWWLGTPMPRASALYQHTLHRAFVALADHSADFRKALLATGTETLCHSLGEGKPAERTCLTSLEFVMLLSRIRSELRQIEPHAPVGTVPVPFVSVLDTYGDEQLLGCSDVRTGARNVYEWRGTYGIDLWIVEELHTHLEECLGNVVRGRVRVGSSAFAAILKQALGSRATGPDIRGTAFETPGFSVALDPKLDAESWVVSMWETTYQSDWEDYSEPG